MRYQSVYSTHAVPVQAVAELKGQLKESHPKMLMYFASVKYDLEALNTEMSKAFPEAILFGCSTSGEIASGKMFDDSLVAMAFSDEVIADARVEVLQSIRENAAEAVKNAFTGFEKHFGIPMDQMPYQEYAGIVLIDGLSGAEEKVNDQIGNLTSLAFIGGSAGDNLQFNCTHVFANGKTYTDAAVLVLIKFNVPFSILKTQSFTPTSKLLKVTKANEADRRVIEFNHKPATQAYAEYLEVPQEKLPDYFQKNPIGLIWDENDPFVRSPRVVDGTDILFYCSITEGMEYSLLQSKDIVEETRIALQKKKEEMNGYSALINFHCILRTLELKGNKETESYGSLFGDVPSLGFSTYGESYIGHLNQTSTILLLK